MKFTIHVYDNKNVRMLDMLVFSLSEIHYSKYFYVSFNIYPDKTYFY